MIALAPGWFLWQPEPSEPGLLLLQEGDVSVEHGGGVRVSGVRDEITLHRGAGF